MAARCAARVGLMPITGNLFHHAIEMFLKGELIKTHSSTAPASPALGHKLDVLVKLGEVATARAIYEEDLAIAQRLAVANPSSAVAQCDLVMSHVKLGALGSTSDWLEALLLVEALSERGLVSPGDQPLLAFTRKHAKRRTMTSGVLEWL